MECVMKQKTVRNARKLLDTFEEKAFDGDFVLPEYLPEMAAVLACRMQPTVESRQLGGNRLIVDGTVRVQVLYVDQSRNRLFTYETGQPFTASFTTEDLCEPAVVYVEPVISYVNYRAIGPRRLDIRGAWRLYATVFDTLCSELPDRAEESAVCLKKSVAEGNVPARCASKQFTVNEVLDIGGQIAEKIVRCSAEATVSECKILPGKAILKGEITVHSLYEVQGREGEDTPTYASCDHTLLYSQMVDCIGLNDTEQAEYLVSVLSCDVRADREEGTGQCLLVASIRLSADLQVWESCRCEYISDAYGLRCPATVVFRDQPTTRLLGSGNRRFPIREEVELPEGVCAVVDVWCDATPIATNDGAATYRLLIHLLAADNEGILSCYERAADVEFPLNSNGNAPYHRLHLPECSYRIKDGNVLELDAVGELHLRDLDQRGLHAVCSLALDESHPYPSEASSVKMIFAEEGESVWEIAKSCHTSVETVASENDISEEVLSEKCLLLIPLN